jgi:hypothetical protein
VLKAIFLGVHDAVVDRATWEKVQAKRGTRKKTQKSTTERSLFSTMLKCADCGSNLHFHFNQKNREIKYFNCSNNNSSRGTCPTTHYVREDFLKQVVLLEFNRLAQFANYYEDDFVKEIIGHSMKAMQNDRAIKQKELDSMLMRDKELDRLFSCIYEDNVTGKISDERFAKLSGKYEQEQAELTGKIKLLKTELQKEHSQFMTTDTFLGIVRRYTDAQEITQRMVTELIDHIEVFHAERVNGVITQKIIIHYNCIGVFEVPSRESILDYEISVEARKGVAYNYSTLEKAG